MAVSFLPIQAQSKPQHASSPSDTAAILMTRVGDPSADAVDEFKNAGMTSVQPHTLTPAERSKVEAALASLPPLHQSMLLAHLNSLAFVDGIPGEGTGLTSPDKVEGMFTMTFRASLIEETLPSFLTTKEQRVFTNDGSGVTVSVVGTGVDALTYVLLHESTHVLDGACGISKTIPNQFNRNIWVEQHHMTPELSQNPATHDYFHGGRKLPIGDAESTYNQLAETPFVSMYATAAATEDLAELVAWREIQYRFHGDLAINVEDTRSGQKHAWHPLTFPAVFARFPWVDAMEAIGAGCPNLRTAG